MGQLLNVSNVNQFQSRSSLIIEKFLHEKEKKSVNTAISYKGDIAQFVKTAYNKQIEHVTDSEWNKVDETFFVDYFDNMYKQAKKGNIRCKNSTLNRKQSTIKELLKYLKKKNIITTDISYLESIKNYNDDTESVEHMSLDIALQFAEYFLNHEKNNGYEKYCLALLAIDTGLRKAELLTLEKRQLVFDTDDVTIRGRGKGNKKWTKKISHDLYDKIKMLDNKGERIFSLSEKNVTDMMTRGKKILRHEERNYSFHSFRKTAVTFAYRLTNDILEAKRVAGHASLDTTNIYLQEENYGASGAISLGESLNPNLYKEVDHETLLRGLGELKKDNLFLLNLKINEIVKGIQ